MHKFSSIKKYYESYQVSSEKTGWYLYTETGGTRILKSASPPSNENTESETEYENDNENEVEIDDEGQNDVIVIDNIVNGFDSFPKVKSVRVVEEYNSLKRLIRELTSDNTNFFYLYIKIINAERNENSHADLESYYFLGEELEKRFEYYKKYLKKSQVQLKVSKEIREQLPKEITDDTIQKITNIAIKITKFFYRLSDDKAQRVTFLKRIKTFTAYTISGLSQENIEYVVSKVNRRTCKITKKE